MPKHDPYNVIVACLSVVFMMLMLAMCLCVGCRQQSTPIAPPTTPIQREEVKAPALDTFLDATKDTLNASSAENVGNYYVSGFTLLLLALGVRAVSGSWKAAVITVILGSGLGAVGVLLENYARVVLLIPLCGLGMLLIYATKKIAEWRTGYSAFNAAATTFETADIGPNSNGKKAKTLLANSDVAELIEQALIPLRKLWERGKTHTAC